MKGWIPLANSTSLGLFASFEHPQGVDAITLILVAKSDFESTSLFSRSLLHLHVYTATRHLPSSNTSTSTLALLRRLFSSITTATHYTSALRRDSSLTYQPTWTAGQHERTAYRHQKHQKQWLRTTTTWQLTSRISH